MLREFLQMFGVAVLCAVLAACETTGHGKLADTKSAKEQDAVQTRVALGKAYMEQGKYELALENLQKALDRDANSADAHTVIAVLYERLGNMKAAEQHYARA